MIYEHLNRADYTWPIHNGWLGIVGPPTVQHGPGQDAHIQSRLLGASYHDSIGTDIPKCLIVHHHENSTPYNIGQTLKLAKSGSNIVLDIHSQNDAEILGGIIPAAIVHCKMCLTRFKSHYDRVLYVPQPSYQHISELIPVLDGPKPLDVGFDCEYKLGWWGPMVPYRGLKRTMRIVKMVRECHEKIDIGLVACGMTDNRFCDYPVEAKAYAREVKIGQKAFVDNQWRPLDLAYTTMAQCDLFCLPGHRTDIEAPHNHSRSAAFLLSFGKPVLVSPDPEFDDVRPYCFTVNGGTAENFAMWVRGFLLDSSLYEEYSEKAKKFAMHFGHSGYAQQIRDFLDDVI